MVQNIEDGVSDRIGGVVEGIDGGINERVGEGIGEKLGGGIDGEGIDGVSRRHRLKRVLDFLNGQRNSRTSTQAQTCGMKY